MLSHLMELKLNCVFLSMCVRVSVHGRHLIAVFALNLWLFECLFKCNMNRLQHFLQTLAMPIIDQKKKPEKGNESSWLWCCPQTHTHARRFCYIQSKTCSIAKQNSFDRQRFKIRYRPFCDPLKVHYKQNITTTKNKLSLFVVVPTNPYWQLIMPDVSHG